jgi:hypothetical protein
MKKRKLAAISLISMFTFLGVKTDKEAQAKIKATEKRTEFVHNLNSWQKLLFTEIEKYDCWPDKYEAYNVLRYTIMQESTDYQYSIERKNGREISFGRTQLSIWVVADYWNDVLKRDGQLFLNKSHNERKWYIFNTENNIRIFVWNCARWYKRKSCWKYALSIHCMGPGDFSKWSKRNKLNYYPEFVNRVRKRMPREIRGIL